MSCGLVSFIFTGTALGQQHDPLASTAPDGVRPLGIYDDARANQPPHHQIKRYPAIQGNDPLLRCGATDRYGFWHINRKGVGFTKATEE